MKIGRYDLSTAQAIVVAAALLALGAVLTWAPEDTRSVVLEWLGYIWALAATFGPRLLTKRGPEAEAAADLAPESD